MKPLVSVLILTFNRTDLLEKCVDAVLKSDYSKLEIVVSDNGSQEDIKGFIKKNFKRKKIKIVRLEKNRGLTGGFNFGFKYCKGKYVFILSNDTRIDRSCISNMVGMMEKDEKIGITAPKIIQEEKPKELHNVGSFLTFTGTLYHYGIYKDKNNKKYQKSYYIFSSNGAGFLVRKETAKITGLFDEESFVYYDESDLCHRVWLSGFTVVYCPKAVLYHLWGRTINTQNSQVWFWNQRNQIRSFIKNFSLPYLILFLGGLQVSYLMWFVINILKRRFKFALTLPQTYIWHVKNIKKTWEERNFVQKRIRRVSDFEILEKVLLNPDWKYYLVHFGNRKYRDKKIPARIIYS
ncbi:MAG TPA: glycosyltransferase family 2 protein [Patescibacteria group bacterium]